MRHWRGALLGTHPFGVGDRPIARTGFVNYAGRFTPAPMAPPPWSAIAHDGQKPWKTNRSTRGMMVGSFSTKESSAVGTTWRCALHGNQSAVAASLARQIST